MTDIDRRVLELSLRAMSQRMDELIAACMDGDQIKAPDRGTLMRSRACLPPYCEHSLRAANA